MSGLSGGVYTEFYRAVRRALSTIRNNGVSAFQGEVYTGRIGPIVGTLESVRIIEVSARRGSTVMIMLCSQASRLCVMVMYIQ